MPMDNLSGGEKCVAALALLFAVHRYGHSEPSVHQGRGQMALPTEDLLITCLYAAYVIQSYFFQPDNSGYAMGL